MPLASAQDRRGRTISQRGVGVERCAAGLHRRRHHHSASADTLL